MLGQTLRQRLVVALMDGLGMDYYEKSPMPVLKGMAQQGFFRPVRAVSPTVTKVNNVSVCCGAWPDEHGIAANAYYDPATGQAVYMNAEDLIRTGTIFQWARRQGTQGVLLTSKRKTAELFHQDTLMAIAAESPPEGFKERYGAPPDIYSGDINVWLWRIAIDLLWHNPGIEVIYVHTTDYPMHTWRPEEEGSLDHLSALDALLGEAKKAAAGRRLFHHRRPRHERQEALLGPDTGLRRARLTAAFCLVAGARLLHQAPPELRRLGLGLASGPWRPGRSAPAHRGPGRGRRSHHPGGGRRQVPPSP